MSVLNRIRRRSNQRGVTLIELSITLVVTSVIMSAIAFTTTNFFRYYQQQLDKATAQQTGRVVVDILRHYVRRTGWGFQANALATGDAFIGNCGDDNVPSNPTFDCNNVVDDEKSDRLRIAYGLSDGFQAGVPETGSPVGVPAVIREDSVDDPLAGGIINDLVFISGNCGTGEINHNFAKGTGDNGSYSGTVDYRHQFTYSALMSPPPATCGAGYQDYNFGRLEIVDFKIDRVIDPGHPTLLVRLDPRESWDIDNESVMVIARDVDDLQVQYGIDTDPESEIDRIPDDWCHDIEGCETNPPLTLQEKLSRIVALQIAVVVRTERYRAAFDHDNSNPEFGAFDNYPIPDSTDGYRRYIYRTTVSLRNNSL